MFIVGFCGLCKAVTFKNLVNLISKASLPILLYLLESGESNFSTVKASVGMNETTVYRGLENLESFKLVLDRREGNERLIRLSSFGEVVARKVKELEELLEKPL